MTNKQRQRFISLTSLGHLCGSQEGNGTFRKTCWDFQTRGHTIAAPARRFMSFTSLNIHQSPHGGYSTVPRERVRQWWIDPLSRLLWASFHSSRACSCLGKHIRALQRLCTGDLGILMQWEWLPWTQLVQGSSRRIWMWSPWCHL